MIEFFNTWIESIIVVVFLSIIVEFLLNESKYKKIVNILVNIYLIFVIINPIFNIDISEWKLESIGEKEIEETSSIDIGKTVTEIFKADIEKRINTIANQNSIQIKNVEIDVLDNETGEIENIKIQLNENYDEKVKDSIRKKISEEFEISYESIIIKGV